MKNSKVCFLFMGLALFLTLVSCKQNKKEKVTDIPVTTSSQEALASFRQGLALFDVYDTQKARTFFIKAIEQDPKLAIAYIFKAESDLSPQEFVNDLDKAKTNLEGASDWEKLYYDYYSTFLSSDWNKRLEITQKMVNMYPDAARAQVELGYTYMNGNDETKARECFQKAIELNSKWVGGYHALTYSYLENDPKDFKKAEENALEVLKLAPSSQGAEIVLGDCYRAQNNLEKARDTYSKAIELDPNASEPYYKKGHANTFLGNLDEARQNYIDGGKNDRTKTSSVQYIAYSYLYGGNYQAAMQWLLDQLAKVDSSGEAQSNITLTKEMWLEDCAHIAFHYGDALKLKELIAMLDPLYTQLFNDVGTQEAKLLGKASTLGWQAMSAAMEGNIDEAKAKAEEIQTTLEPVKDPTKLSGYEFAMGYISMKQKDYSAAITHFEKTQQTWIYHKYWLAMANEAAGNKDKANALFKDISDYNFNDIGNALIRNEVKNKLAAM
ncbi:MAG: tetratricopeptide repeat protein [Bacteroidetes bacterium]|nr:tetratricopeptide repeat protein [Bacteroidota bacterium]